MVWPVIKRNLPGFIKSTIVEPSTSKFAVVVKHKEVISLYIVDLVSPWILLQGINLSKHTSMITSLHA